MSRNPIEIVKQYIKLRWDGNKHATELAKFFSKDGCIIDAEGVQHQGSDQLSTYFSLPTPTPSSSKDPIMLHDGRVLVEFSVVKYLMTWNLKAYFEFDDQLPLFKRVTIERPSIFG